MRSGLGPGVPGVTEKQEWTYGLGGTRDRTGRDGGRREHHRFPGRKRTPKGEDGGRHSRSDTRTVEGKRPTGTCSVRWRDSEYRS